MIRFWDFEFGSKSKIVGSVSRLHKAGKFVISKMHLRTAWSHSLHFRLLAETRLGYAGVPANGRSDQHLNGPDFGNADVPRQSEMLNNTPPASTLGQTNATSLSYIIQNLGSFAPDTELHVDSEGLHLYT